MFCDIDTENVFESTDVEVLYEVITEMHKQKIDDTILKHFQIDEEEVILKGICPDCMKSNIN